MANVEAAERMTFTSVPPGQMGRIQVPQGIVNAGDCDCVAN